MLHRFYEPLRHAVTLWRAHERGQGLQSQLASEAACAMVDVGRAVVAKSRGSFPSDEALLKLFFLALRNISKSGRYPSEIGKLH